MKQIVLTISFDEERIKNRFEFTDALNETLHTIGLDLGLGSNEETGAYVGLDWEYDQETQAEGVLAARQTSIRIHGGWKEEA